MKNVVLCAILCAAFACGCSTNKAEMFGTREQLSELYTKGYSIRELSLRTNCPEDMLTRCVHGDDTLSIDFAEQVKHVYLLDKENQLQPINKLEKNATECLWQIYTKAQNLLILSQYTHIGISNVANALTKRRCLPEMDSLRVLIAYVNMQNEVDSIPTHIAATPYYRENEGIENIRLPQTYKYQNISDEKKAKVAYYLWRAKQFELEANQKLEISINDKIHLFAQQTSKTFIEEELNSKLNDVRCLFKSDEEVSQFYKEKLNNILNVSELESQLKEEILSYCMSINCSRILLVNEMLNYRGYVDNLPIASKIELQKLATNLEGIERLVNNRRIDLGKEGGVAAIASLVSLCTKTSLGIDLLVYEGINSIANEVDAMLRSKEDIDMETQMSTLCDKISVQTKTSLEKQMVDNDGLSFKDMLDSNTSQFYFNIQNDLNINP